MSGAELIVETYVLLPMPLEAPVTSTVLPSRRLAIADAILRAVKF